MSVYRIFQTPDHVVIQMEKIHDTRVIPLDGRPHVSPTIRQHLGDSRGRWDGDTLVVETTNFHPAGNNMGGYFRYADENLQPDGAIHARRRRHACATSSPSTIPPSGRGRGPPRSTGRRATARSSSTPATKGTSAFAACSRPCAPRKPPPTTRRAERVAVRRDRRRDARPPRPTAVAASAASTARARPRFRARERTDTDRSRTRGS